MQDWHFETLTAGQAKLQQVHLKTGVLFEEVSLSKQQVNRGGFMTPELTSASPLLPLHTLLVTAQEESQEEQPHINWTLNIFESCSRQQLHGMEEAWSNWKIKLHHGGRDAMFLHAVFIQNRSRKWFKMFCMQDVLSLVEFSDT